MGLLITGIILGLMAGISPGPLLALVISETLKHGKKEGIKIALTPFITDLPAILLSSYLYFKMSRLNYIPGIISLAGSAFLLYLAYESITFKGIDADKAGKAPVSFRKGIVANLLSPHPYLFWISVGTPLLFKAYEISLFQTLLFLAGFYFCLAGSKIAVAIAVEQSKAFLTNKLYIIIIRTMGIALLVFAALLVKEGLELLDLI